MSRSPTVAARIETIFLTPGETITVWLTGNDGRPTQVELRVRHDGTRELFTDGAIGIRPFNDWHPDHSPEDT